MSKELTKIEMRLIIHKLELENKDYKERIEELYNENERLENQLHTAWQALKQIQMQHIFDPVEDALKTLE